MTVRDRYHLLSSVVRIANSTQLSHPARLKSLARFMAATFKCSVTFYLQDEAQRYLTSCVSSTGPATIVNCQIPVGEGIAGLCALEKAVVRRATASSHPDEINGGNADETVAIPIMAGSELYGVVSFGLRAGKVLSVDDQAIRAEMLTVAAGIIEMVRLGEENDKKLKELASLYRVSNTMLSTIRLNKLIHLILTVLTSGPAPFFDRAMLFLINERAGIMQGMLGVDSETTVDLFKPAAEEGDLLSSRWDIADEDMSRQRDSAFSRQVRESRLPLDKSLNMASRAVLEKRLIYVPGAASDKRVDREFVRRFGITSFATAPLLAKERIVGVVIVDNPVHGKPLHQDDLRFLQLFMNQAGMAIENSMLYDRIEDTNRSLRETQEQLIQGERLATIGEMAARIAHELKGPLVSIGGFARRLEKKLPTDSAEWQYAETIVVEVIRLEKMLTDILSFSRKAIICYTSCNITDIVESALAIAGPAMEQGNIRVCKHFPSKTISFLGDCQQLKQVFINLFLNAQEAMKGGGQLDITIAPTSLNGGDAVSVKVADTGGGIPLEALNNIFNPFFTTKETGTGLGLPIANRIITNHGGKLLVINQPGTGVEFTALLPLKL